MNDEGDKMLNGKIWITNSVFTEHVTNAHGI